MKTENRYKFETSPQQKGTCPNCHHKGEFRFMFNVVTGLRLPRMFGRCERVNNCGYAAFPTKENYSQHYLNNINVNHSNMIHQNINIINTIPICLKFIDANIVLKTKQAYHANNFVIWLQSLFGKEVADKALQTYHVGTSKDHDGTIFWYSDIQNQFRTGKIIVYQHNGRRSKTILPYFVHTKLPKNENEKYEACFYGEHLLNLSDNQHKTVAIVESEKSAIIANIYHPEMVWLACGGANGLTESKMQVLKNRKTILVPDLDKAGRKPFSEKATEYKSKGYKITLYEISPETNDGSDIADFLIREKPTIKQVPNEAEKQIIVHYQSYKLPYDYTDNNDLQSLVKGFNVRFHANILPELYFETLVKFGVPIVN